jgi:hypothetical protein
LFNVILGEQHYQSTTAFGSAWSRKNRDIVKKLACIKTGITVIDIPYWWDGTSLSLQATINKYRPDLFSNAHGPAISSLPPKNLKGIF